MKSLFSYLITFFAIMFWAFRVVVCLMCSMKHDFICVPVNLNIEIVILFLTIPSIIFIIRRNAVAAVLYFGMYAAYFGTEIFNIVTQDGFEFASLGIAETYGMMISSLGIVIPLLILLDIWIQKSRFIPQSGDADWYYENKKYDRQFDPRADRNEYKIK